ncbi:MAG: S24 family peptidase [FCB group bacterium]|jgi:SOS-response transcriptional repressor LexA|nr:S24 family peptidase [FCB group bacterium]
MKRAPNPNSTANLPTTGDNARQDGAARLKKEVIQMLLVPQPGGRYLTVAEASLRTGVPKASIYADLRRIRADGLAHYLPPHHQSGRPQGGTLPSGQFSYPLYEAVQAGMFVQGAQHDPEPVGTFESDVHVPVADRPDAVQPFAMTVRGDSMTNHDEEYHFPHGSRVLVDPNLTPHVGDFVVVSDNEDGGSTLKQMVWMRLEGAEQAGPALRALNPDPKYGPFPYDNLSGRFRVVGTVVDSQLPAYRRGQLRRR